MFLGNVEHLKPKKSLFSILVQDMQMQPRNIIFQMGEIK